MTNLFKPGKRLPAVCRDGVTRSAVITGHSPAYFGPYPAAVQVYAGGKRRTVSGFLSYDVAGALMFTPYPNRVNAGLIPWTSHKPRLARIALKLIKATCKGRGLAAYIASYTPANSIALADLCRTEAAGLVEPPGQQESPGWIACRLLRRLPGEDLNRLAVFFDRLARFQSAAGD